MQASSKHVQSELCYSAHLLAPFLAVVRASGRLPAEAWSHLEALDPEHRVRAKYVHAMLTFAEHALEEPALGLKASAAMTTGDAGMFDFLMSSAETPRMAVAAAARYLRLVSDVHDLWFEVSGTVAVARLASRNGVPRAVEDFAISSLIRNHIFAWPPEMLEATDAWFRYDAPANPAPYHDALGPVRLHFGSSFAGISFPTRYLDVPLVARDARLHAVLRVAADRTLADLPACASITERVRQVVTARLASARVSLVETARSLNVHPRKLSRALAREGTTFEELAEGVRRDVALHHVACTDSSIKDIAALTGFAGRAPFHRAFRRWTGETPSSYRRRHTAQNK